MFLMTGMAHAQGMKSTPLFTKNLLDIPGKEAAMLTVEYRPGYEGTIHRHNADVFVYVLEGSIVMQVRGGPEVTLGPGETYFEGLNDVHVGGRNASKTKSAKFLVIAVKKQGTPLVVPEKQAKQ
ncbi:quercetin dioxygenase-like cupin family protein [Granulicella aggregans]|uniref:Quercetin dioxygenase-like cupin family protein n=1 Tax=Granulicella aggregans TaxID=474949 RepID=A0A7W7ZII9_9BACT|nr:quercetin dioxygenase-like cupin family protein [Granulicella aggregans]